MHQILVVLIQIKVGYQTNHFDVCPGAQGLYRRIVEENLVDDKDLAIQSAKLHDTLFYMEKVALKGGVKVGPRRYQLRVIDPFDQAVAGGARTGLPAYTREQFLALAQKIATEIMRLAREMGLEQEHNYVSNHVRIIKDALAKLSPGREVEEGTCGYNTDARTGKKLKTPGGLK